MVPLFHYLPNEAYLHKASLYPIGQLLSTKGKRGILSFYPLGVHQSEALGWVLANHLDPFDSWEAH